MKLKNKTLLGVLAGLGLSVLSSQAAVVVIFEQVGADVTATWTGSIHAGDYYNDDIQNYAIYIGSSESLIVMVGEYDFAIGGTVAETGLTGDPTFSNWNGGFLDFVFYVGGVGLDNGVDDLVVSNVVFDGTQKMTWSGTTLAAIGADNFSNTLAWTSSEEGTNTISYTTVVPEPSSIALLGLGAIGLVTRRKRQA